MIKHSDRFSLHGSIIAVGAAMAALGVGCSASHPETQEHGATNQQDLFLYADGVQTWPGGTVPVCYDPVDGNNAVLLNRAKALVANSWSLAANVTFTGWGACKTTRPPDSAVRLHFVANAGGVTVPAGRVSPSGSSPGFTDVALISNDSDPHQLWFRYETIHEFGHVLGFGHEQERPDNWNTDITAEYYCSQNQPGIGSYYGTYETPYFDTSSIMDYCATPTTQLSAGDIAGARKVYPGRSTAVYGFLPSNSGNLVGHPRPDDYSVLDHTNSSGHVLESYLSATPGSGWGEADLTQMLGSPAASSGVSSYVRSDGLNAIVHRSSTGIVEILLNSSGWHWSYLAPSGVPAAASNATPSAYKRSDGYSSVLYRTSSGQIVELYRATAGSSWNWGYLAPSGIPTAASDPIGYVRADLRNSVIFRSTANHIIEISLNPTTGWAWYDLTIAASGSPPLAAGTPTAYVRADSASAVAYRNASNGITELSLGYNDTRWSATALPTGSSPAASDPVAYIATFATSEVIYRSTNNHLMALYAPAGNAWALGDLSTMASPQAPAATGKPTVYMRADGIAAVVYFATDGTMRELAYIPPTVAGGSWTLLQSNLGT